MTLAFGVLPQAEYIGAWNFAFWGVGCQVGWMMVEKLSDLCPGAVLATDQSENPHEAGLLKLDSSKARSKLIGRKGGS